MQNDMQQPDIQPAIQPNLKAFMKHFKQLTGYYFKKHTGNTLWHLSYNDHILRKDEDIRKAARYILENPVRKGLTKNYLDYPYSGSEVFDIREL